MIGCIDYWGTESLRSPDAERHLRAVTFVEQPTLEKSKALLNYWSALPRPDGSSLPLRTSVRPADLKSVLNNIVLVEVIDAEQDFRTRLTGQNISKALQNSSWYRTSVKNGTDEELRRWYYIYCLVTEIAVPVIVHGAFSDITGLSGRFETILLPFGSDVDTADDTDTAHASGGRVAYLLTHTEGLSPSNTLERQLGPLPQRV